MRLPSLKSTAIALIVLALVYLLGTWLLLPRVLQSQAEKFIAEKTGHRLTMDRPEFNPFKLSLTLHNLHLVQPNGAPLLAFKELLVDFSSASVARRAWVFDAIRLDGLEASIVEFPNEKLNWSALLESLQDKTGAPQEKSGAPQAATPMPRLEITHLTIAGGGLEFADRRTSPGFSTRIQPLDLHLEQLSTLPDDKGQYRLSARTDFAKVGWQGEVTLNPLTVSGHFDVEELSLAKLAPMIKLPLRMALPEGTARLSANYRLSESAGQVDLALDQIEASLAVLKLRTTKESLPLLALDSIAIKDGRFDLRQRKVAIGSVVIAGGGVSLARDAQGRLNVLDMLPAPETKSVSAMAPAPAAAPEKTESAGWRYRIDHIALSGLRADFRDQTISPAPQLTLQDIAVSVDDVSENLDAPWPLHAAFNASGGGRFEADGNVVAAQPAVDLQLKLVDLSLKPAQPYLGAATTLTLASGALSAAGRVRHGPGGTGYSGSIAVNHLRLTEEGAKADFLAWKSLTARKVEATPAALQIGDLALLGLNTQLIIAKDKSLNFSRIVRPPKDAAKTTTTTTTTTTSPPAVVSPNSAPPYRIDIDRLRIADSELEFADYSLALPFGTHIHDLHGTINGLSSRPNAAGQLELDGQVDDYGVARAAGEVNLFDPTDFMDLKVIFHNIEMTRLTPYTATFAGRKIQSGKLSLDLDYKIKQRQLAGENKVIMDQLVLGERVKSAEAKDLPLDLAIALLQDSDGRIDLGLPVSGSLDDPQFSFGGIVWKVIVNVLTKIVTSPFRALGAMFGGEQGFDTITFEAGRARLTPPEREKLVKLAATLAKRPALALAVHGTYADTDHVAIQDLQLRRAVAEKNGDQADAKDDPGPMSTGQPKVQSALEALFVDRVGRGELVALKEGFRSANPGQLEEGKAGQLLSRMTTLFSDKHDLTASEVAKLKGANFHAVLYQRLRDKEVVTDEQMQALAKARGEATMAEMKIANAPMDRISLLTPEKISATGKEVPLKMDVMPAAKPAEASPAKASGS